MNKLVDLIELTQIQKIYILQYIELILRYNILFYLIELTQIQKMNLNGFQIQRLVFCPIQEVKIYSVLARVGYACICYNALNTAWLSVE